MFPAVAVDTRLQRELLSTHLHELITQIHTHHMTNFLREINTRIPIITKVNEFIRRGFEGVLSPNYDNDTPPRMSLQT